MIKKNMNLPKFSDGSVPKALPRTLTWEQYLAEFRDSEHTTTLSVYGKDVLEVNGVELYNAIYTNYPVNLSPTLHMYGGEFGFYVRMIVQRLLNECVGRKLLYFGHDGVRGNIARIDIQQGDPYCIELLVVNKDSDFSVKLAAQHGAKLPNTNTEEILFSSINGVCKLIPMH